MNMQRMRSMTRRPCAQSESDSDAPSRQRFGGARRGSLQHAPKRARSRAAAAWWSGDAPAGPLAQAAEELVMESSLSRGLASAECFEVRAARCMAPLAEAARHAPAQQ